MTTRKGNIETILGLSPMQEGILFHTIHAPESSVYFNQYACTLRGPLNVPAFERAWQRATDRHGALRSLFTWERKDRPLQIVRSHVRPSWLHEDLRDSSEASRRRRVERHLDEDRRRGFKLDEAPLTRFALFRTADDAHRFVWSFHHLLLDGWSMRIVLSEALRAYEAFHRGDELDEPAPRKYADYLKWLRAQDRAAAEAFWRRTLRGFTTPTPLPADSSVSAARWAERHATLDVEFPEALTADLSAFGREHRLTLNTLIRGAWALLLGRHADEDDVVFGATLSGRSATVDGIESMVGLFINTLPVRVDVSGGQPLIPWLSDLQRQQLDVSTYEYSPLVDVQKWSEVPSGALFQSILVFENHPASLEEPTPGGVLRLGESEYVEQSNFPLSLLVVPGDRIRLIFVYDSDRFDRATITRLSGQLETLLHQMVGNAKGHLGDLSMLSDRERKETLIEWNTTDAPLPSIACIHHLIERRAADSPETPAIISGDSRCTYRELLDRSGRVARRLRSSGIKANVPVVVAIERSPETVIAILGVLRAGGAYVPVDPTQPSDRLAFVLHDVGAGALLTTREHASRLRDAHASVICVDEDAGADLPAALDSSTGADDLAYVIYTSGSTGRPKGVAVTHRNLVHSTTARSRYYPERVSRYCLLSPFVFDSSVAGLFWTLCDGGTLVLPPPRLEQDVSGLRTLLETERVTHLLTLPALYALLLEHGDPDQLRTLETVVLAGEACTSDVVRAHFERVPKVSLYNEYGPTEATVWCTVHRIEPATTRRRIPIGRPISNTRVYVLDKNQRPVPVGVPGELCVGGEGVATGYFNRPDETAERFVTRTIEGVGDVRLYRTGDRVRHLPDGNLEFLGRLDYQIKIRGHRVELGEIEGALRQHPAVREAAVVFKLDGATDIASLVRRLQDLGDDRASRLLDDLETDADTGADTLPLRQP